LEVKEFKTSLGTRKPKALDRIAGQNPEGGEL
jgi:hypothetical protein